MLTFGKVLDILLNVTLVNLPNAAWSGTDFSMLKSFKI